MNTADLKKMTKAELVELVVRMQAEARTAESARGRFDGRPAVFLPLESHQKWAVSEYASEMAALMMDGQEPEGNEVVVGWRNEAILPNFDGLMIQYGYDREAGINVEGVWGARIVR